MEIVLTRKTQRPGIGLLSRELRGIKKAPESCDSQGLGLVVFGSDDGKIKSVPAVERLVRLRQQSGLKQLEMVARLQVQGCSELNESTISMIEEGDAGCPIGVGINTGRNRCSGWRVLSSEVVSASPQE